MASALVDGPAITDDDRHLFDESLELARRHEEAMPAERRADGKLVVWAPQRGSQEQFLRCPMRECLYHGTRGPGKTDGLLMDFGQHVGRGFGSSWRGVLFRQTYPQLADVVAKSEKWFRRIFPAAKFNRSKMLWEWPDGEVLMFRHLARPEDYWHWHGHEYPWIGFEELTNWADDVCYKLMLSCCRSSDKRVPRKVRATTNPYGIGHGWVKERFRLHGQWWKTIVVRAPCDEKGRKEHDRCAIYGHIDENLILLRADPDYKQTITSAARNESMAKAWLYGSWDIVAGGMFDDVWDAGRNVVMPFSIPDSWHVDRAFDWGSSRPFSVGWYAQSDGSDLMLADGRLASTVRGDLFRVQEWYGWTGHPNDGKRMLAIDVAKGIVERELSWGWRRRRWCRVSSGPADSSIFDVENGVCIGEDMARPVRVGNEVYPGVEWLRADKSPGSRVSGWEMVRKMLRNARGEPGRPREWPGLFIVGEHCPQFLRTVLSLPRDEKKLDDVDTDAEDHIADEVRYRVRMSGAEMRLGTTVGHY